MSGRGLKRTNTVSGSHPGMQRRTVARSSSVTRPQTAHGSSSMAPPSLPVRSSTPPASRCVEPVNRGASTPEREDTCASSIRPNFLDDTNMSAVSTGAVPLVKPKSKKEMLEERQKVKEDKETKALIAEMEAVIAMTELHGAQKAQKCQEAKQDELKSEVVKHVELIEQYNFSLETIPSYIQAQAIVDDAKKKKEDVLELLHGSNDSKPATPEEITNIGEEMKNLKSSLERIKSALTTKRIALPIDELEKALHQTSRLFKRMKDYKQITRVLKKLSSLLTLMEKLDDHLEKLGGLLEEKNRLGLHLASLKTSLWFYEIKKGELQSTRSK